MTPEMTPEERNAWAAYDGHRIDRAELKAVLVRVAVAEELAACAAALCEGCRLGERVTLVEGFPYHAAPAAIAPGPHGEPCDAAAIRARA